MCFLSLLAEREGENNEGRTGTHQTKVQQWVFLCGVFVCQRNVEKILFTMFSVYKLNGET